MTADTKMPPYLPYPRFLMEADLALATKLVYAVLLDRAQLSQANGWADDNGQIYIVFPIVEIANAIDRSPMTVKNALNELETAGLIERQRRGQSQPNRIFVKIPDGQDIVRLMDKKLSLRRTENCPPDGQKTIPLMDRKLSTNNLTSNLSELPYGREGACARARGRYENVFLLWGGVGTGKSYFAGCIANALMEQEIPVRMTNFALILNDLTASFEGRNEYIARLCRAPLLILDDFGMERGTEYGLEQVYNVIDSRYRSRKPLIVTTNLSLQDLQHPQDTAHARIYDRLLEMCAPIRFSGENFRRATAQDKLARLKNLMD